MSVITALRRTYKNTGTTTDCQCIRIELQDGIILRYTDSIVDFSTSLKNVNGTEIAIDTVTYSSLMGLDLSSVGGTAEAASEVDLEGILLPLGFSKGQIAQGLFEDARIFVFLTNYLRPVEDEEKLFTGFWGETTLLDGRYITKFTSLLSVFEVDTSRVVSQFCDTSLGSTRCGVQMEAGARTSSISTIKGFDPITGTRSAPLYWFDFSDSSNLTFHPTGEIRRVTSKVVPDGVSSAVYEQTTAALSPTLSTINGVQCADFSSSKFLTRPANTFNVAANADYSDIFIVIHNSASSTNVGVFGAASGSVALGPIAVDAGTESLILASGAAASTSLAVKGYTNNIENTILTTGDLHTYIASPSVFLYNFPFGSNIAASPRLGTVVKSSITYQGCKVAEILIYPQLKNDDRRKVADYLSNKYGVSTDLVVPSNEVDQIDAKRRRVVKDDIAAPYLWFEALNSGNLGPTSPLASVPLGDTITDNEVEWLAVPARVIELTCIAGEGMDSLLTTVEELPSDFADVYNNGKLEFLSGPNEGLNFIILDHTLDTFTLNVGTIVPTEAGDEIRITIACDRDQSSCINDFRNGINFQGFPEVPTESNIYKLGDKV